MWFPAFRDNIVIFSARVFKELQILDDDTTILSRNVGNQIHCDALLHPRRTDTSSAPLRKP